MCVCIFLLKQTRTHLNASLGPYCVKIYQSSHKLLRPFMHHCLKLRLIRSKLSISNIIVFYYCTKKIKVYSCQKNLDSVHQRAVKNKMMCKLKAILLFYNSCETRFPTKQTTVNPSSYSIGSHGRFIDLAPWVRLFVSNILILNPSETTTWRHLIISFYEHIQWNLPLGLGRIRFDNCTN